MKLINPFKRKKEQKQNNIITVKYSKLDNIGKVKQYEIPDKNEIDSSLNEMNNKITELTNKLNRIPQSFFERIDNLRRCNSTLKEITINAGDIQREYLTIGNKEYMHFFFANYPTPTIQVELNELSVKCQNLVKIYLVGISGGGVGNVGTYDWSLYNYLVYTDVISNPKSYRQTITVKLPNFRNRLFWLVSSDSGLKDPNLFNNAKLTIRIDYFSNLGGEYYRNVEGEGDN